MTNKLLLNNKKKRSECEEDFSAGVSNCGPNEENNLEYLSSSESDEMSLIIFLKTLIFSMNQ